MKIYEIMHRLLRRLLYVELTVGQRSVGRPKKRFIEHIKAISSSATLSQVTWRLWQATEIYGELSVILVSGAS